MNRRTETPMTPMRGTPTRRAPMATAVAAAVATTLLTGCAGTPVTHSDAAPITDASLGLAVRQARALQTLHPMAGQDPLLPDRRGARSAMSRPGEAQGGRSAPRSMLGGLVGSAGADDAQDTATP